MVMPGLISVLPLPLHQLVKLKLIFKYHKYAHFIVLSSCRLTYSILNSIKPSTATLPTVASTLAQITAWQNLEIFTANITPTFMLIMRSRDQLVMNDPHIHLCFFTASLTSRPFIYEMYINPHVLTASHSSRALCLTAGVCVVGC